MNLRSLHVRLILWYSALVIGASLSFCLYTYSSIHHRLYLELQQTLTRRVSHICDEILPAVHPVTPDSISRSMREVFSPEQTNLFIRISREKGEPLYVSGPLKDYAFDPASVPLVQDYSKSIVSHIERLGNGRSLMVAGTKTTIGRSNYIIEMGAPTDQVQGTLDELTATLLLGLPFVIAIALLGGSVLVRRAFRPVEDLRATTEKISSTNLRQRLPVSPTGDALERLSVTLNKMLERLDQSYQQATRFAADAAHELRTPLTIMRSELESIIRIERLPKDCQERVAGVLEEAERLSSIVDGLFALARLDGGEVRVAQGLVDMSDLVRTTIDQMHLLPDEKKISVTIDAPAPILVMGDAGRLRQVVVNLLDNAVKYTPVGGAIILSVLDVGGRARLAVRDNGIGLPPAALPHVFDRFYRADKARSRGSQGAGLGLSIVQSICHAHGGTVGIDSTEGVGTVLTVDLPLANVGAKGDLHAAA